MIKFSESNKNQIVESIRLNRALLIDFDGTLVDYSLNERRALEKLFESLNLPKELFTIVHQEYSKINSYYWSQFELKKLTIKEVQYKRFADLMSKYNIDGDAKELNKTYLDYLVQTTSIEKNILEAIKKLRDSGVKIVIITNGIHWTQTERLKNTGLDKIIDAFFTSESVGFAKPHPKMFLDSKKFLESIDCPTNDLWVIGDNFEADIKGAFNVGYKTCWVNKNHSSNSSQLYEDSQVPTLIANNFLEFVEFYNNIKYSES